MTQVVNTNIMAMSSRRITNVTQSSMSSSLERLSSGLQINRARDDASGLAISERYTSQIRGLDQAVRNANDGISLIQTAEGALAEVETALQRMRELAVQSSNGTYNSSDRSSLNEEYSALASEINRISGVTEFNNINLLNNGGSLDLQVGWDNGIGKTLTLNTAQISTAAGVGSALQGTLLTAASAGNMMDALSGAIETIANTRADFGAVQNRLESTVRSMQNVIANQSAARSQEIDADFGSETANLTRTQIMQQAGTAMMAQANSMPEGVLSLLR